ncbi:hypothetical protein FH972_014525 [Carpinus fangiana]|uniref:Lipoxygenase domain-containing protein n=1 Tax=Carpinus fangiana TaxID=176857 RepID=A0A5N6RCQ4_9ROSI|nr:hypothetical protein FH972_014525 [Carpinus fangiana]
MAVCGIKRNFEDLSPSPLACKRVRYSCSTSPINNQIPHNNSSTAIKNPHELSSESAEEKPAEIDLSAPTNGVEWTHSLIKKLMAAKSVEDAMVCTTGVLGDFERSIGARIEAHLNQEIMSLKEQAERLTEENTMLKRAVPDKVFLKTVTAQLQTLLGISLIEILSSHSSDKVYLGQRDTPEWTTDAEPLEAFKRFGEKLDEIKNRIIEMNNDETLKNRVGPVKAPYTLLYPTSEAGITGKGIPNSASI